MQNAAIALAHNLSAQHVLSVALTAVHLMLALPCRYVFRTCQVTQRAQKEPVSQCMQDSTSDATPVWLPTCMTPRHSVCACQQRVPICLTLVTSATCCRSWLLPSSAHSHSSGEGQPAGCFAAVCSPAGTPGPRHAGCARRTRLHPNNVEDGSLYLSVTMLACSCLAKRLACPCGSCCGTHLPASVQACARLIVGQTPGCLHAAPGGQAPCSSVCRSAGPAWREPQMSDTACPAGSLLLVDSHGQPSAAIACPAFSSYRMPRLLSGTLAGMLTSAVPCSSSMGTQRALLWWAALAKMLGLLACKTSLELCLLLHNWDNKHAVCSLGLCVVSASALLW